MSAADLAPHEGTRGRILDQLARAPCTARNIANTLGIQESAARGHLERLRERGYVTPTFRREGVGRPRKRYALTSEGQELFPKRYDLLLDALMDEILARQGEEFANELFASAASRVAHGIARGIPKNGSLEERTRHLVDSLNAFGFNCTMEKMADGGFRIVRSNCVFRRNALSHARLMCNVFDQRLTETLIGQVDVDLQDTIGRGGMRCSHLIHLR
ncbi:MAG: ArsR family transcriptional regulator [Thermoplasmata archaeon]|nr:ArsR family transcriptional regulator [Thermoplasmata archaeon]